MRKFFVAVFIFCLFSCDREVTVEPIPVEQELVVNAFIGTNGNDSLLLQQTFNADVSKQIYDGMDPDIGVSNAEIYVIADGDTMGKFKEKNNGLYFFEGDSFKREQQYQLVVNHSNFSNVSATTMVPLVPNVGVETYSENNSTVWVEDNFMGIDFQIMLAFKDDEQADNYYCISAVSYSECVHTNYYDRDDDVIKDTIFTDCKAARLNSRSPFVEMVQGSKRIKFVQNDIDWEGGYSPYMNEIIFSDKFFNGEKVTIPIDLSLQTMLMETKQVCIKLTAISEEYYQLFRSLAAQNKNNDGFFPEALEMYSNVTNGKGIWAGKSSNTITIEIDGEHIHSERYN